MRTLTAVRYRARPDFSELVRSLRARGLTFLDDAALMDLHLAVRAVERRRLPGLIVEAGCALGGSAIAMAWSKAPSRPLCVYDVFEMIPPPSERDGEDAHRRYEIIRSGLAEGMAGRRYYGYEDDLRPLVEAHFADYGRHVGPHNVDLIKGRYEQTLEGEDPIALAHIDCDWYDSVMTCLSRLTPRLVPGGVLVIDDYSAWSGCRRAVDDFLRTRRGQFTVRMKARLHVTRR